MGTNLPPGVTPNMIPGSTPADTAYERCLDNALDALPSRFDQAVWLLNKMQQTTDLSELEKACYDFINLFEPTEDESNASRMVGHHISSKDIFDRFMTAIENVAAYAAEWENPPEAPEPEPYDGY